MEGCRRAGALALVGLVGACAALAGCDDGGGGARVGPPDGGIVTDRPEYTFAPIVYVHPSERYLPKSGRQFVSQSTLYFGGGRHCPERRVARGQYRTPRLTEEPTYSVRPYVDADCRRRSKRSYGAQEVTRPHEDTAPRAAGLPPDEGFYLDLDDSERRGPPARRSDGRVELHGAAAWNDKRREQVGDRPGMRVTYWLLFGMHAPRAPDGRRLAHMTHEGDWERVDVLLHGAGRRWKPVAVRTYDAMGREAETPWGELTLEKADYSYASHDRGRVHPVLLAALGTHNLRARRGDRVVREVDVAGRPTLVRDVARGPCRDCPRMETALPGFSLESQDWYGFGGAWGEPGRTTLTTGPLGPRPG